MFVILAILLACGIFLYVKSYMENPNSKEHIKIGIAYLSGLIAGLLIMFLCALTKEII